ncbi:pre-peptidase C-terminal domain-containing protein [Fimbriiglobus ruber]|uniref:High-affnity carbon uptake protein Hat/HatR n=1 Tax=Fimbriiglobus ruber TaxID=1908690 RepID=A0A225DTM4_9BACT|nr:pre-peptidase C-terminal domain-containing protein [Fimbriiglobus ruber]OWK44393.1 High-affnity carbon uptake protein Hat/HatR [Fimbriiglobus ruber]
MAGNDLEEPTALIFDHPGLKAERLKDRKFKVSIAANVPAGTYDLRVVGKYGVSNPRLFAVSSGLVEVEKERKKANDTPETAQVVAVNTAVNGVADGNREDFYRFAAKKGQRVTAECRAQQLDSFLDATMSLTDADGKLIASNGDYFGRDPFVDFIAPRDGDYCIGLHDLSYRGGQPYRLIVTDHPQVENVFPRVIQAGKPTTLTVYGRNLGTRAKPSEWKVNDLPLDALSEEVTAPADLLSTGAYHFFDHPAAHSVLPTAATCTLTGFQTRHTIDGRTVNGVPVLVTDTPVTLEHEPNDDPTAPQKIGLPAVVAGRFDRERDADWYEFETTADGAYSFDVYCERIGGRADPYLVVLDDKDQRVGELDDYGHRMNAFDGHLRDPSGSINLAAKRKYRVLVQDRYRRGGARYQYVLTIHRPTPDFYPAVIHGQNPGPAATVLRRGDAQALDVVIHAQGGYTGPVTFTAEGLPKGLHVAPTTITNDTRGSLVLWADADAPDYVGPIKLIASGKRGDEVIRREVRGYTRVTSDQQYSASRPVREWVVAVLPEPAPFALRFEKDRVEVEAGKKVELKLRVDRPRPEFQGPITVTQPALPSGIKGMQVTVGGDKSETTITFEVQAGTRPGDHTVTVVGQAQVPFVKEAKPGTKPTTLAFRPAQPVTLVVTQPVTAAKK